MLKEFRDFAVKGNALDLAIGVMIGAAFGKIVDAIVGDIFTPIIGAIGGGLDFTNYFVKLSPTVTATTLAEAKKQGPVLAWGDFVTVCINFIIIAFILFLIVRAASRMKRKEAEKPPTPSVSNQEKLLEEIRDLLAKRPV